MPRETDDSMTAISSGKVSQENRKSFSEGSNVPLFHARGVDQTGNSRAVEPSPNGSDVPQSPRTPTLAPDISCRRTLSPESWGLLERGLRQRFDAVSACMDKIVSQRTIPALLNRSRFLTNAISVSLEPVQGTSRADIPWTWLASTDLYWAESGELTVLDHNFALPTGLEKLSPDTDAASMSEQLFSDWVTAPGGAFSGGIAVLDPGFYSATFRGNEFLARCLKAHLVRSSDLTVRSNGVFLMVGGETVRISTIVRRIDDDLLDPNCFRPESLVGLPGLVRAWKNGLVDVISPPGGEFANSRSFGRLIPEMIREFLNEEPLLNSVEVVECGDTEGWQKVVANAEQYAIRTSNPRHPAQPFFGSSGSSVECSELIRQISRNPTGHVARPLLPKNQTRGLHIRVFATMGTSFRLLRRAIGRKAQPDGGAPFSIGNDAETFTVF